MGTKDKIDTVNAIVPMELIQSIPYVVTILIVSVFVKWYILNQKRKQKCVNHSRIGHHGENGKTNAPPKMKDAEFLEHENVRVDGQVKLLAVQIQFHYVDKSKDVGGHSL